MHAFLPSKTPSIPSRWSSKKASRNSDTLQTNESCTQLGNVASMLSILRSAPYT